MSGSRILIGGLILVAAMVAVDAIGAGSHGSSGDKPGTTDSAREAPAPHGDGGRPLLRPHPPKMTAQEEQQILETVKKYWPDRYKRLMELKKTDPGRFSIFLRSHRRFFQGLREATPEVQAAWVSLTDTKAAVGRTLEDFHKASDQEKPALKEKLRELLSRQIGAEHLIYRHRLARLEKRIAELREDLRYQVKHRDEVIKHRLEDLIAAPPADDKDGPSGRAKTPR